MELPPLAQFSGRGHESIAPHCSVKLPPRTSSGKPLTIIFGNELGLSNRFASIKNPVAAGLFRLQWRDGGPNDGFCLEVIFRR
jgi:hypothetical protein